MEASTGCIVPYITQTFEGSFNLLIRTFWADFPHKNCQLGLDPAPPKALQNPNPPQKKEGRTILPLWDPASRANYVSQDVKVGKIGEERPTAITLHQPSDFAATSRPAKFLVRNKILHGRCKAL